ncbi:MAG: hypothetical protein AAF542_19460 [Pseudomonadota bacterium]
MVATQNAIRDLSPSRNFADKVPFLSWEWLSSLRDANLLSIGYFGLVIVPAISLIIGILKEHIPLYFSDLSLPPVLFFIYIGSLSLSISHFFNDVFCPHIIKKHGSLDEYTNCLAKQIRDVSAITEASEELVREKAGVSISEKIPDASDDAKKVIAEAIGKVLLPDKKNQGATANYLSEHKKRWDQNNTCLPAMRWMISAGYLFAFVVSIYLLFRQLNVVSNSIW